jgi:hypothetical protein
MIEIKKDFLSLNVLLLQKSYGLVTKFNKKKEDGRETVTASKGWFARFEQRSSIRSVKINGEFAIAGIAPTSAFTPGFRKIIEDNDFPPDLVFNVDETGLY